MTGRRENSEKFYQLSMTPTPTCKPEETKKENGEKFVDFYNEDCDKLLNELNEIPPANVNGTSEPRSHGNDAMTSPREINEMEALIERNQNHVSSIKALLRQEKIDEYMKILVRAVKRDLRNAVSHMLTALKDEGLDICEDRFREPTFSATILHAAILYKRDRIAIDLMTAFPRLVTVKYASEVFNNQTCFHLASANGNMSLLRNMLQLIESPQERAGLLNTVADGSYFINTKPEAATCLSAAAWTGQFDLIDILVKEGADLDLQGPGGNTLLHCIVFMSVKQADPSIYQGLVEYVYNIAAAWWRISKHGGISLASTDAEAEEIKVEAFRYLLRLRNSSGLTPITMAVNLNSPLAPLLLSFEPVNKLLQTRFGAVSWATYDVTDVVSWHPGVKIGRYDPQSVLHIMAHRGHVSQKDYKIDLTSTEPVRTVVDMKWSTYRYVYFLWSFAHLAHMIGVTIAGVNSQQITRPGPTGESTPSPVRGARNSTVAPGENQTTKMEHFVVLLLLPALYIIFELVDIIYTIYVSYGHIHTNKSLLAGRFPNLLVYIANQYSTFGNGPYRIIIFTHSIAVIAWFGLAWAEHQDTQIALSVALILGWNFLIFFTRAVPKICRLSIMIQKMFFRDFAFFGIIYFVVLIAFSTGVYVVLPPGENLATTFETMISIVVNTGGELETAGSGYKHYASTVLTCYASFCAILLVNLLIAAMNTSYEVVKDSNTNICKNQRLSILLMLERRLFWFGWLCRRSQSRLWLADGSRMKLKLGIYSQPKRVFVDVTEDLVTERRRQASSIKI